ncbi:Cobalt-zinc-cadmium resistance protein czcD [Granulibacter bethesdensis CGDNIH4]|nr:Cobalt-zinc-cadmium resistance protein czcD [Granulibacter bethesdensis CGDNIH4]
MKKAASGLPFLYLPVCRTAYDHHSGGMASASSSRLVVFAALGGNFAIAVMKFAAAASTGSSAMLSEAVHSLVDTGNQLLMLWGMRCAARPATPEHPFGHGLELYFWSFMVAVLIFGLGAGVSIFEGIEKLRHPVSVTHVWPNYLVLGGSFVFEGIVWLLAMRAFLRQKGRLGVLEAAQASKDPTVFTVLFEDTAALLGLLTAGVGLGLAQWLHQPAFDAIASLVIGGILAVTALFLARESRSLLIGESAPLAVREHIRRIVASEPGVVCANEILTMHFGPSEVLVAISMDFENQRSAGAVEAAVSRIEQRIRNNYPEVRRVFVEAQGFESHRAFDQQTVPG